MDIRKLVDINDPAAIEQHMAMESRYRNYLMSLGKNQMTKADKKQYSASRRRCKALEQAYTDTIFADNRRDSQFGGH